MHTTERVVTSMIELLHENLPLLQSGPEDRKRAYFILYYARLIELLDGAVRLAGQMDRWAPTSVLLRSALECTVDLKNLACAPGYEHVVRAMMLENRSAVYRFHTQPAYDELVRQYGAERVEQMGQRAQNEFRTALKVATRSFPFLNNASRNLSVLNRFRIAGMERMYQEEYTFLSMVTHNDMSVLAFGDVVDRLPGIDGLWDEYAYSLCIRFIVEAVRYKTLLFGRDDELVQAAFDRYMALREETGRDKKNRTLMDLATIGAKTLKKRGLLPELDESEEINACSIHVPAQVDGKEQDWLLMFKNETHNHPTEIEPFGGAATCIGGCIRDPLSGRVYVHQAMRLTGCGDPRTPVEQTLEGKLPQRKIAQTAAAGYSSYGNQIGLATGHVAELYHEGYVAKHLECGAVVGAAPASNVRRERPAPGDVVILLGGRTGRDGIGGATGSSKAHKLTSLETCGAEVQKGNAPIERKLQRLFRTKEATLMIKRCNDFGAGGVSVAIGELADGLSIDLDAVPKKYDGLDGTELAISESQERMAVVVEAKDADAFIAAASKENLEATRVALVTAEPRLVMRWKGRVVCDIAREFLNSNGAEKHARAVLAAPQLAKAQVAGATFSEKMHSLVASLNVCSKKGLAERFDSTIGAGTVLMPFGGRRQLTPIQAMVDKLPVLHGETRTCAGMAWGYNPFISEKSPYHGAYLAVAESISKLVATGLCAENAYLTFQEYFQRLGADAARWGQPVAALLGALDAQADFGVAAIGGKDSMSGTFENIDVPPTLVSFAVAAGETQDIVSPEFKLPGSKVVLLRPAMADALRPEAESLKAVWAQVQALMREGRVLAAYTPGMGGVAEALFKMCAGNGLGFRFDDGCTMDELFSYAYGSFVLELTEPQQIGLPLGTTTAEAGLTWQGNTVTGDELRPTLLKKTGFGNLDDMYAAIGYGGFSAQKAVNRIRDELKALNKQQQAERDATVPIPGEPGKTRPAVPMREKSEDGIVVQGLSNCLVKFSKCCTPVPGDDIVGFITRGYGVSVHRADCPNAAPERRRPEEAGRWVKVSWGKDVKQSYQTSLDIYAKDRIDLVLDVSAVLSSTQTRVAGLNAKTTADGFALIHLEIFVADSEQLSAVMRRLHQISGVMKVDRPAG